MHMEVEEGRRSTSDEDVNASTTVEDVEKRQLTGRIHELEEIVRYLEHRVKELEERLRDTSPSVLTTQADNLLHHNMTVHVPWSQHNLSLQRVFVGCHIIRNQAKCSSTLPAL